MKSLLITHDFPPGLSGGISNFYHHLCHHLGADVSVLAPKIGDWQNFDVQQSYRVYRQTIPTVPTTFMRHMHFRIWHIWHLVYIAVVQFLLYLVNSCRVVSREKVDLILVGHLYLAPVGWLVQKISGHPYAIILHGSELHRYWRFTLVKVLFLAWLHRANFLVVNSDFTRQQYLDRGVSADQSFIKIYPGTDVARFRANMDKSPVVQRHNLVGRQVILTVARLVEWKGQDTVIRAMGRVLQVVPTASYLIVGNGPYRQALEQLVADLNLQDHVTFAGFVPDEELALYYAAANVMVLVSREFEQGMPVEGFGIAYLEANAAGQPVIGSRLAGALETVVDGVTGLLVNPDDEAEVAAAIVRLLTDPDLARQMGRAGRERAVREFTWEKQAARLKQELAALSLNGKST